MGLTAVKQNTEKESEASRNTPLLDLISEDERKTFSAALAQTAFEQIENVLREDAEPGEPGTSDSKYASSPVQGAPDDVCPEDPDEDPEASLLFSGFLNDGLYDFDAFKKGVPFEEYSAKELKVLIKSKNEMARALVRMVHEANRLQKENLKLRLENENLRDEQGRKRETEYGTDKETARTLDPQLEGGQGKTDSGNKESPSEESPKGQNKSTGKPGPDRENPEKEPDKKQTGENTGQKESEPPGNPPKGSGDPGQKKTRPWTPKRKEGCSSSVVKDALRVHLHKALTQEQLDRLAEGGGKVVGLPDGKYEVALYFSVPVVMEVTYERARNRKTKKTAEADSAHRGKYLPGSRLTPELLARIVFMRCSLGLSVPRILKDLKTWGFRFTKQSLYCWFIQYGLALIRPLVMRMLIKILEAGKVQSDETWTRIREDLKTHERRNSVLWLLRTSEKLEIPPIIVVFYTGSRAADELADLIRGYSIKLMADGYSGYGSLLKEFSDRLELVGCLQHSRAKFVDVVQALKGRKKYQSMSLEERKNLNVNQVLALYKEVFRLEDEMDPDAGFEDKKKYRIEVVKPAMDRLFERIESEQKKLTAYSSEYWKTAVNYAMSNKDRFYAALEDPEMPLNNSACERVFANYGILRSNYKQLDTVMGAIAMTSWFSVTQTARLNDQDEQIYILYLIEKLPAALKEHGDFNWYTPKQLNRLEQLPTYGDLSYLDKYLPDGDDFRNYAAEYPKRSRQLLVEIAGLIKASGEDAVHTGTSTVKASA